MGKLEGKIALVTGGNSGICLATAKRIVSEGAYTFITGRRSSSLAEAAKEIGKNVTGVQGDVSSLGDLDRLFAQIKQEKGRLDIVFANAGIAKFAAIGEITEELYHSIFEINVKGLLFTVQKALPLLPDGASIILNASIVASKGLPSNSVYSATKAAVRSFARTWTTDLKHRRIRVNAVSPGSIDTPGLSGLLTSSEKSARSAGRPSPSSSASSAHPTRSRGPSCFSPPTTAATSRGRNSLSMAASRKCRHGSDRRWLRSLESRVAENRRGRVEGGSASPARAVAFGTPSVS
jgi:NAD(P)-dependent dehydrogenase (short-subunit alcohol dehydrogenase family)